MYKDPPRARPNIAGPAGAAASRAAAAEASAYYGDAKAPDAAAPVAAAAAAQQQGAAPPSQSDVAVMKDVEGGERMRSMGVLGRKEKCEARCSA